jgi:hypothetical protein
MPVSPTRPARSWRRSPLGRIAVVVALAGAVTAAMGTTAFAATAAAPNSVAAATTASCSATVGHIASGTLNGKAVVTFTGQVSCNSNAAQIYVHTNIFACGSVQPKESHKFLLANCGNKTNAETYAPEKAGVTYTISDETAAADGYFAPVLSFNINGIASGPVFGTPVLCSNGSCTNVTYAS